MANKQRKEGAVKFSLRSQAGILRQEELERERDEITRQIEAFKAKVNEIEGDRARLAKRALKGESFASTALERCVEELRNKREALAAREQVLRDVEAQVAACQPTAERRAEREKNQHVFAELAEERLALDEEIGSRVKGLRELLAQRSKLTGKMAEVAEALEMKSGLDPATI